MLQNDYSNIQWLTPLQAFVLKLVFFYWTVRIKQNYIIVILYKLNWESYSIFLSSEIIYRFVLFYYHKQKIKVTCKILWRFNRKIYTQISRANQLYGYTYTAWPQFFVYLNQSDFTSWVKRVVMFEVQGTGQARTWATLTDAGPISWSGPWYTWPGVPPSSNVLTRTI